MKMFLLVICIELLVFVFSIALMKYEGWCRPICPYCGDNSKCYRKGGKKVCIKHGVIG